MKPKEEQKQNLIDMMQDDEKLGLYDEIEEAAERLYLFYENNELLYGHSEDLQLAYKAGVFDGAKWQAERSYSEEEVILIIEKFRDLKMIAFSEWFEQFKKK